MHPVVEAEQRLDHLRIDQLDSEGLVTRLHVETVVEIDGLESDARCARSDLLCKCAERRCAVTRSPSGISHAEWRETTFENEYVSELFPDC